MIQDLRISYRKNPIGMDEAPRFSWKLVSEKRDVVQKYYQIQVVHQGKLVWDSGCVESSQSALVPFQGGKLQPMTDYQVQVSVWDNYGELGQEQGSFETGLMDKENWRADWITHSLGKQETVCPVFVRRFPVRKRVRKARLYATCCGVYEACINGKKAGDLFLAPGWTSYHHRLQYQTYDVTRLLGEENEIRITVGNGWYKGELGFDAKPDRYGHWTALLAMVCVEYEDGERDFVGTDESWSVETGEILFSEIYYGETLDYTAEKRILGPAVLFQEKEEIGDVVAQEAEPVRVTKRFVLPEKILTPKGETVFDFGQNMAGVVEVRLPELTGEKLVIRHAETLDRDGNFYTENLRTARCTDTYIYGKGQVGMTVMPHFTFHGFRYICVDGAGADVGAEHFTACAMHTDMQQTGSFACDNRLVSQLQSNIQWGQRGNFLDIPTDCPQRDERLGWTGDAQVFCGTASYNFNTALFYGKWLRDMAAEASPEWGVPHVVPNILGDQAGAAAWSDAATVIPWTLYQVYGDRKVLAEQFPLMKGWVDYIRSKVSANGLWQTGFQYGDWLALDIESGSTDRTGGTDKYLVANAYYAYSAGLVREAAKVLGYEAEEAEYGRLQEEIIDAMNREFVTETGRLVSETQTACVVMLHFGIAKPEYRKRILETLETNINAHHGHLTTGFVGTPYLCHCLSENGLHDLAGQVFMKEDFPGWLYAVKKGATTIWERWNSVLPDGSFDASGMNSLNHYAYGSIGSWLYEKVAGIRCMEPGYRKVRIQPMLTKGLTQVSASYESVYGTIQSAWSCRDGKICVDVRIPENTTAVIRLPEKEEEISVGSGSYHYEYETDTHLEFDKYTMDSTLGELAGEELGRKMLEEAEPGMLDSPLIQFAFGMTISELIAQSPGAKPLYQAVIDGLNEKARKEIGI
ncbi:MAG: family 78 glycoside hydrolase catalytic domain [Lachnospiraceae bacterium]|jgi:alpha-L-rhamnosidase|nr:family 78 glycoside hydrolase catalytic domain [uncultured Acetatifactor sp.]MCI9220429.1 family 78 glycoside hydrolase catalytic domain [Lachnospiraceae bacterium]